jgi:transposase
MLQLIQLFVNKLISFGGFKRNEFSNRAYHQLVTAFKSMSNHDVVMISPLINMYKPCEGCIIIDTTDNPKYGLEELAIKMKNLSNGAYSKGFKIVLFLYKVGERTIPIGFGLLHKRNKSQENTTLEGLSILRNQYKLKPKYVLADGAFGTQKITKRLDDYRWGFVIKGKKNYSLDNKPMKRQIQRGYGSATGRLKNGVKVKVVRRPKRFFMSNRVSLNAEEVLAAYKMRWRIEETFRFLKSCIGLNGCHQHSMQAQGVYVFGCLALYSIFETIRDNSIYKTAKPFFSGDLSVDSSIMTRVFAMS